MNAGCICLLCTLIKILKYFTVFTFNSTCNVACSNQQRESISQGHDLKNFFLVKADIIVACVNANSTQTYFVMFPSVGRTTIINSTTLQQHARRTTTTATTREKYVPCPAILIYNPKVFSNQHLFSCQIVQIPDIVADV